jgi:hypothetical protein
MIEAARWSRCFPFHFDDKCPMYIYAWRCALLLPAQLCPKLVRAVQHYSSIPSSRRPSCDNSRPIEYPNMDEVDATRLARRVPFYVSDPLAFDRFDLHVCSNVPPSHIQIRSNDESIVPLNEWKFPIFFCFVTPTTPPFIVALFCV